MNESNRVNLFSGKLIKPIDISDAGLKRIAVALKALDTNVPCGKSFNELMEGFNNAWY